MADGGPPVDTAPRPAPTDAAPKTGSDGAQAPTKLGEVIKPRPLELTAGGDTDNKPPSQAAGPLAEDLAENKPPGVIMKNLAEGKFRNGNTTTPGAETPAAKNADKGYTQVTLTPEQQKQLREARDVVIDMPVGDADQSTQDSETHIPTGRAYQEDQTTESDASAGPRRSSKPDPDTEPSQSQNRRSTDQQTNEPPKANNEATPKQEAAKEPVLTVVECRAQVLALIRQAEGNRDTVSAQKYRNTLNEINNASYVLEQRAMANRTGKRPDATDLTVYLDQKATENAKEAGQALTDNARKYYDAESTKAAEARDLVNSINQDPKSIRSSLEEQAAKTKEAKNEFNVSIAELMEYANRKSDEAGKKLDVGAQARYKEMATRLRSTSFSIDAKGTPTDTPTTRNERPQEDESLVEFYARKASEHNSQIGVHDGSRIDYHEDEAELNADLSAFVRENQADPTEMRKTLAEPLPTPPPPDDTVRSNFQPPNPDAGPEQNKASEVSVQDLRALAERLANDYAVEAENPNLTPTEKADLEALARKHKSMAFSLEYTQRSMERAGTGDPLDVPAYRPGPGETLADAYARRAAEAADKVSKATYDDDRTYFNNVRIGLEDVHKFITDNANPDDVKARLAKPPKVPDQQARSDQSGSNKPSTPDKPEAKTLEERHAAALKRMADLGITLDEEKAKFVNEALGDAEKMKHLEAIIDAADGKGESLASILPDEVVAQLRNKEFSSLVDALNAAAKREQPGSPKEKNLHWALKILLALGLGGLGVVALTGSGLNATSQAVGQPNRR